MPLTAAEEIELLTLLEAEAREIFPDTGPFRRELYPKHVQFFMGQEKLPRKAHDSRE